MTRIVPALAVVFVLTRPGLVLGHEVRPGYLEIVQTGEETFDVFFKVPARGEMRLSLYARMPEPCRVRAPLRTRTAVGAFIEQWSVACIGGLVGETIHIDGLSATLTDVLVRLERADGTAQIARLTPGNPAFVVEAVPSAWEGGANLPCPGGRAHSAGHRPSALRIDIAAAGGRLATTGGHHHGFHCGAQHHPGLGKFGPVTRTAAPGGGRDRPLDRFRGGGDRALPRGPSQPGTRPALDCGLLLWFAPWSRICRCPARGRPPRAEYSPGPVLFQRGRGDRSAPLRRRRSHGHSTSHATRDTLAGLGLASSDLWSRVTGSLLDHPAGLELLANMRKENPRIVH